MKTAAELRIAIEEARNISLNHVREAVKDAMAHIEKQMEAMLANPTQYGTKPSFGDKMPAKAWHKNGYENFIALLSAELGPLGYKVVESHDGGGMYATYHVTMIEEEKPAKRWYPGRIR